MARRVEWALRARSDLRLAISHIKKDSPTAARAFGDAAIKAGRSLAEFSERGRLVPELADPAVRELLLTRYRLVYEVFSERVVVLRVIHASRDFERAWRGTS